MDFNKSIKEIETKIGYAFKDKSLIRQAFTRTSYCNENRGPSGIIYQSNEVLEFFGDSVLSAAIVTLLMRDFAKRYENGISTKLDEGDFSNIKSKLSDKKNLSLSIKKIGLEKYLLMGEGDRRLGIENEPSVMEDLFESIIGAIYIDSGNNIEAVTRSVTKMLDIKDYLSAKNPPIQSHKNALQEFCADKSRKLSQPVYKTLSESGPDHKKIYERACYIGDRIVGIGQGKNQKLADSEAAKNALIALTEEENKAHPKKKTDSPSPLQALKEYAAKNRKPSAEFRDMGEVKSNNPKIKQYKIECRFMGLCASAVAESKREAKLDAADAILSMIKKSEKAKRTAAKKKTK